MLIFWRIVNPFVIRVAGIVPWWVIIETVGRTSGQRRRLPLARGPIDGDVFWLVAVHGRRAGFVRNIEANPSVRIRHRGRWRDGTATIAPMDDEVLARFNRYGRSATSIAGIEPVLVKATVAAPLSKLG
jgi:deazaflavin-dependent oxidoreductase (nitroreductase family)